MKPILPRLCALSAAGIALAAPALALAQTADAADPTDSGDTALVLAMAIVGLALALPGIVLAHGGRLRSRGAAALAAEAGGIAAVIALAWVVVGYTVAFGTAGAGWLGAGNAWMLIDLANVRGASAVPESAYVLLQLGYALFAGLLLTGAWAERGNLAFVIPFAGLWSLLVYAPVAHWVWGGGWLVSRLGTIDYAGALPVHVAAGTAALVLALLIGPRARFEGERPVADPARMVSGGAMAAAALVALGAGSTLLAGDDAATGAINLLAAAAAGALGWLLIAGLTGADSADAPRALVRGGLSGLIAASGAFSAMAPGGAMLAGIAGAALGWLVHRLCLVAAIDDAADVIAVSGGAGIAGALVTAPLIAGTLGGTGYADGMGPLRQVIAQVTGVIAIAGWSAVGTAVAALMVAMVVPMRVSEDIEAGE